MATDADHRVGNDGRCVVSDLFPGECAGCRGHKEDRDVRRSIDEGRVYGGIFG